MGGERDSSKTRVQPLFEALFARNERGEGWLNRLLRSAPHSSALEGTGLLEHTGDLIEAVVDHRKTGALKGVRACFEHVVPPPGELLSWLLRNPEVLAITEAKLAASKGETRQKRSALAAADWRRRDAAICEGLKLLGDHGPPRKRPVPWWAFEGPTSVDCWLETEHMVLFVEGKRTEALSEKTSWVPSRNQLVRNLEVVRQETGGQKPGFVLLAVDEKIELDPERFRAAAPHLNDAVYDQLWDGYLGQISWKELRELFELSSEELRSRSWN